MKAFILIVILMGNSTPTMETQEFDDVQSCNIASEWVVKQHKHISATCLPKGDVVSTFDLAAFERDIDQALDDAEFKMKGDTPYIHITKRWEEGCIKCH